MNDQILFMNISALKNKNTRKIMKKMKNYVDLHQHIVILFTFSFRNPRIKKKKKTFLILEHQQTPPENMNNSFFFQI